MVRDEFEDCARAGSRHARAARRLIALVSALGVLLVVASPGASDAAYPGANGVIIYSQDCNLMTVNPDGSDNQLLLDLTDCVGASVWSPQGKRFVFARGGDTFTTELWLARSDGRGRRQLSDMRGGHSLGGWSPSGRKVIFSRVTRRTPEDIYVIEADGTGVKQLTSGSARDTSPRWSPTARRIAFISDRGGTDDIWMMNTRGNNLVRLTDDITRCDSGCTDTYGGINGMSWSPTGEQITFAVNKGDGLSLLYVMDADGSNLTKVDGIGFEALYPAWSPDGSLIVYFNGETLATIPPEGGRERRIQGTPEGFSPDWQPLP